MDLLGDHPALDLFERNWRIYSVTPDLPPQFIAEQAEVKESLISEGCAVYGAVARSVVFQGVSIGRHSKIKHSVIMHDAEIGDHVELENAIVPPECGFRTAFAPSLRMMRFCLSQRSL